jgi:hypothetical protein
MSTGGNRIMKKISNYIIIFLFVLFNLNIYAQESSTSQADNKKQEQDKQNPWETDIKGWRTNDYQPYIQAMKDITKLSQEYSEIILKLAIDEYSTGIDILEDMESQVTAIEEKNKNKKNLNEKWYWQEVDRKNQESRQIRILKEEAKTKSVSYFIRSINHMDDVQSTKVKETKEFANFNKRLFQVFVSCQYDLHNFLSCIPVLERYILMDEETRKDLWAYKYLTNCYAFMEAVTAKSKQNTEEQRIHYRQLKNKYMLQSGELQYGVDSVEYKHLLEIVGRDEKKSERLNDFR